MINNDKNSIKIREYNAKSAIGGNEQGHRFLGTISLIYGSVHS